jgi:hypothetical protein
MASYLQVGNYGYGQKHGQVPGIEPGFIGMQLAWGWARTTVLPSNIAIIRIA